MTPEACALVTMLGLLAFVLFMIVGPHWAVEGMMFALLGVAVCGSLYVLYLALVVMFS